MRRWVKILKHTGVLFLSLFLLSACESSTVKNQSKAQSKVAQSVQTVVAKDQLSTKSEVVVEKDLWRYIVNRTSLKARSEKDLYWHIDWFKKNPDYLTRVTKRAEPYLYLVTQEVKKANLPIEIALLPIVESAYYPFSYSHGSASGLWQFIPSTGKLYGLDENWWYDARRDVLASTKSAVKYLKNLTKLFKGDYLLAIAAYNAGPGRVQKAIRKNQKAGKKTDFWHLELPSETRGYVPRLLAVTELIKNPQKYGQVITPVENKPKIQAVVLDSQFDLLTISSWAQIPIDKIYSLNPGLKRWATPDKVPYQILLPIDAINQFKQNLSHHPQASRIRWLRYQIKAGDSLSQLAKKYQTTIDQITSINKMTSSQIKAGDYLILPLAKGIESDYVLSEDNRETQRLNASTSRTKIIHKVAKGDSLWQLAKTYQVSINQLVKWNKIDRSKPLALGKSLLIWQPKQPNKVDLSKATDIGINIDRKLTYRVKKGDNLSKIAKKFKVSVAQLKAWNQLDINQPLKIGQKLIVIVNIVNSNLK